MSVERSRKVSHAATWRMNLKCVSGTDNNIYQFVHCFSGSCVFLSSELSRFQVRKETTLKLVEASE